MEIEKKKKRQSTHYVLDKNFGGQISFSRLASLQIVPHYSKRGNILVPPYRNSKDFLVVWIYMEGLICHSL